MHGVWWERAEEGCLSMFEYDGQNLQFRHEKPILISECTDTPGGKTGG